MKRRAVLPLVAVPLAWLGCNGLLGIDDPTFVPADGGASSTNAQDGAAVPIGPIRPSRTTVRLPVNETRTIDVQIVPDLDAAISGASDLAAISGDTLVTTRVAKVDIDRFVVTLVGPASVDGPVETSVRLEGKDGRGATQMTQNIRVLVGPPGSLDTTFGTSGSVVVTTVKGARSTHSFPLALLGSVPVTGDGDGRIHLFENEGVSPRTVQVAAPSTGCSVDAIATAASTPLAVHFGTTCSAPPRGTLGSLLPSAADAPPTTTTLGGPVLGVALARERFPSVLAGESAGLQLSVAGAGTPALVGTTGSSLFAAGDGLFAVGGRQTTDGDAELVLEYTPVNEGGARAAPGANVYTRLVPDAVGTGNTAVGTSLTPGSVAVSWSITSGGKDAVYLYTLGVDGSAGALRILDAYTARLAGDAHGRIVVASDVTSLAGMELRRLLPDGTDDGTFPLATGACSFPAVAVDPDGMIVVSCELVHTDRPVPSSDLVVRRYWP